MRFPRLIAAALGLVAVTTAASPGWGPYVVHRGDTLWGLAQAHHTTVAALQRANHLAGDEIYVGQTLEIPGLGVGRPAAQSPRRIQTVATVRTYTVRAGDTLTSIARAQHTTVATMASLNHLTGRMLIRIGQQLTLPGAPAHVVVSRPQSAGYAAGISSAATRLASSADPGHAAIQRMVVAEARRQGLSPALAQAIATQESGFTQRIVSPTGAIGVMQLEPVTAQYLGVNPYDLASNIRGGITLLLTLERQMGSQTLAIAAYYEGPTAVRTHGLYSDAKAYVASVQALERRYQ